MNRLGCIFPAPMPNETASDTFQLLQNLLTRKNRRLRKYRQIHYIVRVELKIVFFVKKWIHDIHLLIGTFRDLIRSSNNRLSRDLGRRLKSIKPCIDLWLVKLLAPQIALILKTCPLDESTHDDNMPITSLISSHYLNFLLLASIIAISFLSVTKRIMTFEGTQGVCFDSIKKCHDLLVHHSAYSFNGDYSLFFFLSVF